MLFHPLKKNYAVRVLPAFATCLTLMVAHFAVADAQTEFTEAFKAYHDAMEQSYYAEAVGHAEKARRLAEEIYADDAKAIATLAYNHGYALAVLGMNHQASEIL